MEHLLKRVRMDKHGVLGLHKLLDTEETGLVSVDEIVYNLVRMKTKPAKVTEMMTTLYENKRLLMRLAKFGKFAQDNFKCMDYMLRRLNDPECAWSGGFS